MTFSGPGATCVWVSGPGSPKEAQAGAVPPGRSPELRQHRSVHGCHTTSAKSSRCFADHSGINAMSHDPPQQQERLRSRSSSCNEVTMNYATVLKSQRARGRWQGRRDRQSRPGRSATALGAPSPAPGRAGAPAPRTTLAVSPPPPLPFH